MSAQPKFTYITSHHNSHSGQWTKYRRDIVQIIGVNSGRGFGCRYRICLVVNNGNYQDGSPQLQNVYIGCRNRMQVNAWLAEHDQVNIETQ